MKNFKFKIPTFIVVGFWGMIMIMVLFGKSSGYKNMDYPTFLQKVDANEISSIVIEKNQLLVIDSDDTRYETSNPNSTTFKEEMLKKGISVTEDTPSQISGLIIQLVFYAIVFWIAFVMLKKLIKMMPVSNIKNLSTDNKPVINGKKVLFDDIAGVEVPKEQLLQVVDYLKEPKRYIEMGVRPVKGVLLTGVPGTGKTLLAQAVANEAGVPFFSKTGADFVQMYVGVGALRVRELFETAKKNAPCVIFIDEIDALGKKRSGGNGGTDERDQTLIALLTEMNGFNGSEGVIVIAATNNAEVLDPALVRPGRFDKHIEVEVPDLKGREDILKIHAKNKNLDKSVNLHKLAKRTAGLSGADLENILNESGLDAILKKQNKITWENVDIAYNTILVGNKKVRNVMTDKEKSIVAFHETGHALVTRLYADLPIEKMTILPTSKALGYVMREVKDVQLNSKEDLFKNICISLGGRVAESIIFGEENVTNGASQDFKQATQIAYNMVFSYGMSNLGNISLDPKFENIWSEDIKNDAYKEVQSILKDAKSATFKFLKENEDKLRRLAEYILVVENMDGDELDVFLKIAE